MRSRGEGVSDLIHVLPGSFLLLLLDFTHFLDPFPALDCRKPLFWNGVISVIQSGQSTGECTNGVGIVSKVNGPQKSLVKTVSCN